MSITTKNGAIVYSTEHGRMCPSCGNPRSDCACRLKETIPTGDGVVRITRNTKGRKGKCVTVITGIPLAPDSLKKLGQQLKQKCGTGGTVKDGAIEIQGDHRESLMEELKKHGWTVKRSGG